MMFPFIGQKTGNADLLDRGCQESKYYFEKAIMKQGHNPHSPAPVEWIGAVQGHDGFR